MDLPQPTLESMAKTSNSTFEQCCKKINQESNEALKAIAEIKIIEEITTEKAIAEMYLELADIEYQIAVIELNHPEDFLHYRELFEELRMQINIAAEQKSIQIDWNFAKKVAVVKYRYRFTVLKKNKSAELIYFMDYCQKANIKLSLCDIEV